MVKNNENAIREAAYYNWQNAGCPQGSEEYFWSLALEQVSNCSCNSNCSTSSKKSSTASKSASATKSAAAKTSSSTKKSK